MGRYDADMGIEGQYEPGSGRRVLRNLRGVRRVREMDELEGSALLDAQTAFTDRVTRNTRITASLMREMHRVWLGGIYAWAGEYRTVEMSKGGFSWPPAHRVSANMVKFEADVLLRLTPCRGKSIKEVAYILAEIQAELLLVHPFREGNGRLARWLCDLLAHQAGLPAVNYNFKGKGSNRRRDGYLRAVQKGYGGDYLPLAELLEEGLARATLDAEKVMPRAPSK